MKEIPNMKQKNPRYLPLNDVKKNKKANKERIT